MELSNCMCLAIFPCIQEHFEGRKWSDPHHRLICSGLSVSGRPLSLLSIPPLNDAQISFPASLFLQSLPTSIPQHSISNVVLRVKVIAGNCRPIDVFGYLCQWYSLFDQPVEGHHYFHVKPTLQINPLSNILGWYTYRCFT